MLHTVLTCGATKWIRINPDKALLAALLLVYLLAALGRFDYAGDGMRHLDHILHSNVPALGEPRWILFPVLLFAVIKPFAVAGIIQTPAGAAGVFCLFNAACGFAYLLCLRRWLVELAPLRRTAVLVLAGGSYAFLILATNTIEPTPAALIAVAGLTYARFRDGLSDSARLTVATGSIAVASVIYQGLLFGLFFLPAIFSVRIMFSPRNAIRIAGGALAVPLCTIILLSLSGDTPRNAARRFLQGEANSASSSQYSRVSAKNLAGVAIVGPAYAFASIPDLRGLAGTARLLRQRETAFEAIRGGAAWFAMAVAITATLVLLVVRRHFALLLAFAGVMALPAMRMSQYSYPKYYVLLPFLVVLAVPRLQVRFVYPALLGVLVLLSNVAQMRAERVQAEELRVRVAEELYPRIPDRACFLTNGWGPSVPEWPGDSVSWAQILNGGSSESQEENYRANSRALHDRLKKLFCTCPAVVTDAFLAGNRGPLQQELSTFHIEGIPLAKLLVPSAAQATIFQAPRFTVYRFSVEDQHRACEALDQVPAAR